MVLTKLLRYFIFALLLCFFQNRVSGQSKLIQQELRGLPGIKDSISLVNSLNRLGVLYHTKNSDSCFYYGMKAKSLANKLQYTKGEADADDVVGFALLMRGLYKESLELFTKALSTYRQQADTTSAVEVIGNMAAVYNYADNWAKTQTLYRQAIQTGNKLKNDSVMGLIYARYSLIPNLSKDSIRYYLQKAGNIASHYKDQRTLIYILQVKAQQLLNSGQKELALPLIRQALFQSRKEKIEHTEISSLGLYSAYYYYAKKPDSALKYVDTLYQLILDKGYIYQKIGALKSMMTYTELSRNKDRMIKTHRLLEAEIVSENENLKKFMGDYVKYNTIQNDNELLNKKNQLKTGYLIGTIISLFFVALVLLAVWQNRKQLKKLNERISVQNGDMQTALTALEQSQEENTRMMKIVAHDLRSPMAATVNIATILLESDNLLPEDQEMLELMKTSSLHSLDMISDLLNMNTTTEGLMKEPVEMNTLLQYCVNLLKFKATEKKQEIQLEAEQIVMTVNREKIWRVISNLIVNAIKFSPEGSVIQVKMKQQEELVQISIQDQGIGIPEDLKDKIFTMFTGARRSGTSGEQSFGLGLAISRQIVEAHGGKIWFESNAERGTTFFVDLPVI